MTAVSTQPVQLWDGIKFIYVESEAEAKEMVKAGTHQRTQGLAGHQLKRRRDMTPEPTEKPKKKSSYKTRVMKAEI